MSDDNYVENDTQPVLACTYPGVPVTDFQSIKLHIKYKPNPLVIDATLDNDNDERFTFEWQGRVTGVLASAAAVGATSISVTVTGEGQTFADLPATGELVIDGEHVLYTAVSDPTVTLASALTEAHLVGSEVEKLPDLRAGNWPAEIELVDDDGGRITFNDFSIQVDAEIA